MSPTSPSVRRVLARALRERCPACGEGQVFLTHRFRGERDCSVCGWRLERCEGHWIGGTEVNMLLTFPAGVITLGAFGYFFGWSLWTPVFGALFTIPFSLAVFRRSRCLFYAVDYLFDPTRDDLLSEVEDVSAEELLTQVTSVARVFRVYDR